MFTIIVNMSLQMFYSTIMAHMPSAYGLGKKTIFNKVQFSSVLLLFLFFRLGSLRKHTLILVKQYWKLVELLNKFKFSVDNLLLLPHFYQILKLLYLLSYVT